MIKDYKSLVKRSYENQSWHAVNVKRSGDYIKPEEITKRLEEIEATNNKDITKTTLGELLSHKMESIRRNSIGILKQLNNQKK